MSVENAKKFIDSIKSSEEIKAELKELCKIEDKAQAESAFEALAKKNSCECSFAEFMQAQKESLSELSPEELAKVDAGFSICCCIIGAGSGADVVEGTKSEPSCGIAACYGIGIGIGGW